MITLQPVKPVIKAPSVHLPLGISFFTFHGLSYIIDVYRKEVQVEWNPVTLGLYFSFFPQLIAGPIVRYHDVAQQLINNRKFNRKEFAQGVVRFTFGLSKKMLIANTVGAVADTIFTLPFEKLDMSYTWIGLLTYTLQIYIDFSGYSDMAIGLANMFGIQFLENFNYPYTSRSIREFWRRWHISLSNWFRDYLYISLGGNRVSERRVYLNLLTVFLLCGLWHGASWNFIIWDWVIIILFLSFILLPEINRQFLIIPDIPSTEKRTLAPRPAFDIRKIDDFINKFDLFYNDHFGFRVRLIAANTRLHISLFGISDVQRVVIGKRGWLFINEYKPTDPRAFFGWQGFSPYSLDQLMAIQKNLEAENMWFTQQKITFLILPSPEKHSIYSEYLPWQYNTVVGPTPVD
ncbi:unnamed protein product [Rotaria sp. Silwood2]|nr:unnamed protein product [Rotaria sp. Silwood2]CAF4286228.1 unnamed protein product [Rotaria sp. Silwood2]